MVVLGWWLDLILEFFSNLNDSMILMCYKSFLKYHSYEVVLKNYKNKENIFSRLFFKIQFSLGSNRNMD